MSERLPDPKHPIYVMRHAEPIPLGPLTYYVGSGTDRPLSANGIRQAHASCAALESLELTALYSSPLLRASQTARIIGANLGLEVEYDDRIRELHFGLFEGMSHQESREKYPEIVAARKRDHRNTALPGPDGESPGMVAERGAAFLRDVQARQTGPVLIVSHKAWSLALLYALDRFTPENAKKIRQLELAEVFEPFRLPVLSELR